MCTINKSLAALSFSLLAISTVAQKAGQQFRLTGKYAGNAKAIFVSYLNANGKQQTDSSEIKNGAFSFTGLISEPTAAYFYTKPNSEKGSVQIFLEPKTMAATIKDDNLKDAVVTGSTSQNEWTTFSRQKDPVSKEMEPLSKRYSEASAAYAAARKAGKDEKTLDSLKYAAAAIQEGFEPYREKMKKLDYAWFAKNPKSVVTAYYLRFYVSGLRADSLQMFYDKLGATTQNTSFGKSLEEELIKLQGGSPGSLAKNFATKNINGKMLELNDFKGKYVLIDFWASWCVPCRKENPHLKELYARYKAKGFEVIGVSDDDRDSTAWKNAIAKDDLPWEHVLRGLKYDPKTGFDRSKDISDNFGIHTLPTQILIDPAGKIIARFGGGGKSHEELDATLASVIK